MRDAWQKKKIRSENHFSDKAVRVERIDPKTLRKKKKHRGIKGKKMV